MNILDRFHHWRRKRRWNKQYKSGRWESLKSEREALRYHKIIDLFREFGNPNPSILDIGCGDGVLNRRMGDFEFSYFLGVDFSEVSIEKAKAQSFPKSEFLAADAIDFVPSRSFDIIIFNEAFYYIPESEKLRVLNLMLDHLNSGGILMSSIFREGQGVWEYFKEHPSLTELEFTRVNTDKDSTYWKIGVYRKAEG